MIYFPGTINTVSTRLYCHIIYISNEFTFHLLAMHVNSLCAYWHSEVVKGLSSLSSRRLLISLWVTSPLFLCPQLTDAPYLYYGARPPPFPKMAPLFTGSAHTPFPGYKTISVNWNWVTLQGCTCSNSKFSPKLLGFFLLWTYIISLKIFFIHKLLIQFQKLCNTCLQKYIFSAVQ